MLMAVGDAMQKQLWRYQRSAFLSNQMKITLFNKEVWNLFLRPSEVVEVRIPKVWGKSAAWGNDFAKGTVSGYFDDHVDLGSLELEHIGGRDAFMVKLNFTGDYLDTWEWGGGGLDMGAGVAVDYNDYFSKVYVTGCFSDDADLDPNPNYEKICSSNGGTDIFLIRDF